MCTPVSLFSLISLLRAQLYKASDVCVLLVAIKIIMR